jgi:uncharacterized membrane protein
MELGLGIGTLSLVTVFALVSIASIVIFIYYSSQWAEESNKISSGVESNTAYTQRIRTEYAYYATVILLLFILSGMHGFGLIRELL